MNYVEPIKSKEYISKIENWLTAHNKRNRLIFAIGINTGLRISDILALNISDVYRKTYIEIHEKKTGKYKRFPLNKKLQELIRSYLSEERKKVHSLCESEPLFVSKKHYRLERTQVYRFMQEACKSVGLSEAKIGCHTLRKTFAYHHYKQFNNIALLQKILNHSSTAITLRYIGIDQEEIDMSYNSFEL